MSDINKHLKELCGKESAMETKQDSSAEIRSKTNIHRVKYCFHTVNNKKLKKIHMACRCHFLSFKSELSGVGGAQKSRLCGVEQRPLATLLLAVLRVHLYVN